MKGSFFLNEVNSTTTNKNTAITTNSSQGQLQLHTNKTRTTTAKNEDFGKQASKRAAPVGIGRGGGVAL